MPELPEVETVVRGLREPLIGRTFVSVWYERAKVIQIPSPDEFVGRIVGQKVQAIERRAKYIVCQLDHDYLLLHLRMTGRLYVVDTAYSDENDRWLRLRMGLDNGEELRFSDSRRFGRVYLTTDPQKEVFSNIGPEPLADAFTAAEFAARLRLRGKAIKPLLLDQAFLAGVGNIYADESLFRAKIHPLRAANSLTAFETGELHRAIRSVLSESIEHEGASVNWYRKPDGTQGTTQHYLYVYDRDGEPCRVCGSPIERMVVGQRGTHFCPNCQPKG
jgi:formamidopyrimidine-DNA glycosylase